MGGMLSQPITSKMLVREGNKLYRVGSTDMQGYRLNMEDAMTVLLGLGEGREDWALFGVYDGHAGARASAFLGEHLHERVCQLTDPFDAKQLQDCVSKLDAEFCSDVERRFDGSTCVFAIVRPSNAEKTEFDIVVSNTGDSRVVIIRKDTGACVSMTTDHKPSDEPERERIYAAGGTVSMNRTDGQLAMSRAFGDFSYKSNTDLAQDKQKVIPTPDITFEKLSQGDTVLVMCDGIVEQMTNEEAAASVVSSMKEHDDPALAAAELFTLSLDRGSKDNHSAIIVVLEDGTQYGPKQEFVAGPYHPFLRDSQFKSLYEQDAARHGISGEVLAAAARKTEEKLGPFETDTEALEQQSAGRQYLRLLAHIQQSYDNQNLQFGSNAAEDGEEQSGGAKSEDADGDDDDDNDVGGDVN
eukprot:CAMPEP_0195519160 /NCGR_PEP_ID=MMETSP0794_2-20130614/14489_1 /TAXON_ID=515487 /ORGANISM="Stephanopyxis turris, Strain CCMP 815" /LENGTH=411 /DNA_ID=CAMNT_0040648271 /DNA_START=85 /DNA_END=1320 /DNA_ORIENTATION=+